jgi:hypothetical protein
MDNIDNKRVYYPYLNKPFFKSEYTTFDAAFRGDLQYLKYAREKGCPWNEWTCSAAASNGFLDCLKYAHENGCFLNKNTGWLAASNGHLDCLKYVCENGCNNYINNNICESAALNGHLECLRYAHIEAGCPLTANTCSNAALNGHLECLRYAHSFIDESLLTMTLSLNAVKNGHFDCFRYILSIRDYTIDESIFNTILEEISLYKNYSNLSLFVKCFKLAYLTIGQKFKIDIEIPYMKHPFAKDLIYWTIRMRGICETVLNNWRIIRKRAALTIQFALIKQIYRPTGSLMMRRYNILD